jgi:predicted MFS family arabinose efflux permease
VRQDFVILGDRRFVLLFSARTCSMLGTAFGPVALAFGVLALPGATATTLSVVVAAEALSMVVFMLVGGVIADRLPRFRVMVSADLAAASAWAALATLLITGWAPVWLLVTLSAVAGMASAIFFPASTGVVPEVVPTDRLQAANGLLRLGMNGARIGGYAVAGGCVAVLGAGWTALLNAGLLLASAAFTAGLRLPPTGTPQSASVLRDLREGWREFRSRQWLWVVVAQFSFVVMVLQGVWGVLGPVIANERLGGPRGWSWVLGAEAVGMLLGVVIAMRVRPSRPVLSVVFLSFPLALVPLALGAGAPIVTAVIVAFVAGVALDILTVVWDTTLQREIPQSALSRVSSYDALGSLMLGPLGMVLAGPAAALFGASASLLGCAAVVVLASLPALLVPGVRELRWPDSTAPDLTASDSTAAPGSTAAQDSAAAPARVGLSPAVPQPLVEAA